MDLQLTGKRAIVTGGSRGIGFAVAAALAAEGVDVAVVARDAVMREQFETKVLGYLRCARAVAPLMVEAGWGRIITSAG